MPTLKEQLCQAVYKREFATFDKLIGDLDLAQAGGVAQAAYDVGHIEGFKNIVQTHPQRNYSLVFKQIVSQHDVSQKDDELALWLLETSPATTVGSWDPTNYGALRKKVSAPLYTAMIERQAQSLEPRFLMASAFHHKREDFAQRAIQQLERFPLYHDRKLEEYEIFFIVNMLSFKSVPLAEDFMARFPSRIVLHTMIGEICQSFDPEAFHPILIEVLERYTPTETHVEEVNSWINALLEYKNDNKKIVRCLMPYYNPHYNDGEIFLNSMYLDNENDFLLFLDATPLDVQKSTLAYFTQARLHIPPHFEVLKTRIADLDVRAKLQEEVSSEGALLKKRVL